MRETIGRRRPGSCTWGEKLIKHLNEDGEEGRSMVAQIQQTLREHCTHDPDCASLIAPGAGPELDCDCGYQEVLDLPT